jgi:hypothetical protein
VDASTSGPVVTCARLTSRSADISSV